MKKILAIGNSFSQDATAYLYSIAKASGTEIKVVNLYIGGCSLETHWNNILQDLSSYDYELNGERHDRKISIKEALQEDNWDYVTLQQASHYSGLMNTYYPYITDISAYVKEYAPQAEQLIHQTWAYEIDSDHGAFTTYDSNQHTMYQALTKAYTAVAKDLNLRMIPCGNIVQTLRSHPLFDYEHGGHSLCRDGFHMSLIYGRYLLAATWYELLLGSLLGHSILDNTFLPPSFDGATPGTEEITIIKETIHQILQNM